MVLRDCTSYICHWSAVQQIVSELPQTANQTPDSPNGLLTHPQEKNDKFLCSQKDHTWFCIFFL